MKQKHTFLRYLVSPYAIVFVVFGLIYQCVMLGIYLPSYKNATDTINQIKVAIVNEDESYGKSIAESLAEKMPCDITTSYSLDEAKQELEKLNLGLVIEIPSDFSEKMQNGETPIINYYEDGRQPSAVKSIITSIASSVSDSVEESLRDNTTQNILGQTGMNQEAVQAIAKKIETPVNNNVIVNNESPSGMQNSMAPLFLPLAAYVFGLIGTIMLEKAQQQYEGHLSKRTIFIGTKLITLIGSAIIPIAGLVILHFCTPEFSLNQLASVWTILLLVSACSIFIINILKQLFGEAGSFVAVVLLLAQIISGTIVVSRDQMMLLYKIMSYVSPMYYAVNGIKSFLYGGIGAWNSVGYLAIVTVALLVLECLITWVKNKVQKDAHNKSELEHQAN